MVLSKNQLLGRDDEGQLVPVRVDIPELDDFVMMLPVTRGKLQKILSRYEAEPEKAEEIDSMLLLEHLVKPELTKEEYDAMPIPHIKYMMSALLKLSGVQRETNDTPAQSAIAKAEAELKKKSV